MNVIIETILVICGFFIISCGYIVAVDLYQREKASDRIKFALDNGASVIPAKRQEPFWYRLPIQIGQWFADTGLLNTRTLEGMQAAVNAAGFRGQTAYVLLIGSKIVLGLGLPIILSVIAIGLGYPLIFDIGAGVAGAVVGLLAPEWSLRWFKTRYQKAIENGIADALDLLVICIDSGLGIETAIMRVAVEMQDSYPMISSEFRLTSQDLQISPDVEQSLRNLAQRCQVESVERLANTLIQSVVYGTPLSSSLHQLADDLRAKSLARFEEEASKLPSKMTVPMILFILPSLITVVIGPSIGPLMKSLSHMKFGK